MFNTNQSCLILSPSRTGSTALSNYISEKFYLNNTILDHPECLSSTKVCVGRSHELYDYSIIKNFLTIFSIREDIVSTVVSRIIANNFKIWTWPHHKPTELLPFTADLVQVKHATDQQMCWYQHYAPMLSGLSNVVSYEVVTQIIQLNAWERIDKTLVANLVEVQQYIQFLLTADFKAAHGVFVDWKTLPNRTKIYLALQGQILN